MNLVKESLSFERYKHPKKALFGERNPTEPLDPKDLGEHIDGFDEKIFHEMSGYNNSYDYCKFEGDLIKKPNGKFVVVFTKTVYHGDENDEGKERKGDISNIDQTVSEELNTE